MQMPADMNPSRVIILYCMYWLASCLYWHFLICAILRRQYRQSSNIQNAKTAWVCTSNSFSVAPTCLSELCFVLRFVCKCCAHIVSFAKVAKAITLPHSALPILQCWQYNKYIWPTAVSFTYLSSSGSLETIDSASTVCQYSIAFCTLCSHEQHVGVTSVTIPCIPCLHT